MAWECFWSDAFFLLSVGVIGTKTRVNYLRARGKAAAISMPRTLSIASFARHGFLGPRRKKESEVARLLFRSRTLKVRLDLFQSLPLGLRQEPRSGDEIDHRASRESEEHGGVTILADSRQKNGRNRR